LVFFRGGGSEGGLAGVTTVGRARFLVGRRPKLVVMGEECRCFKVFFFHPPPRARGPLFLLAFLLKLTIKSLLFSLFLSAREADEWGWFPKMGRLGFLPVRCGFINSSSL